MAQPGLPMLKRLGISQQWTTTEFMNFRNAKWHELTLYLTKLFTHAGAVNNPGSFGGIKHFYGKLFTGISMLYSLHVVWTWKTLARYNLEFDSGYTSNYGFSTELFGNPINTSARYITTGDWLIIINHTFSQKRKKNNKKSALRISEHTKLIPSWNAKLTISIPYTYIPSQHDDDGNEIKASDRELKIHYINKKFREDNKKKSTLKNIAILSTKYADLIGRGALNISKDATTV